MAHLNRWRQRSLTEKASLALGMLVLTITLPPFPATIMVALMMMLATLWGAGVPLRLWLACVAAPTGFLLVGTVSVLVQVDASGVAWAPGGGLVAAQLVMRSFAGVTCLLFLALTTPTSDLMGGLRRVGVPPEMTEIALLMYRFLFLLAHTARSMDVAQAARLGHERGRRLRSLGLLIANLLPRAFDRARRLEMGLAARGWDGHMRVLSNPAPVSGLGLAAILGAEILVGIVGVMGS